VSIDSIISSPRKVELFIELGLTGYRHDKLFKGKVTWLAENNNLEHQLNAQVTSPDNSMLGFIAYFGNVG